MNETKTINGNKFEILLEAQRLENDSAVTIKPEALAVIVKLTSDLFPKRQTIGKWYDEDTIQFWGEEKITEKVNGKDYITGLRISSENQRKLAEFKEKMVKQKKEKIEEIKKQPLVFTARECYQGSFNGYQIVLVADKDEKFWTEYETEKYKEVERAAIAEGKTFAYVVGCGVTTNDISAKAVGLQKGQKISLSDLEKIFSKKSRS